LTAELHDAIDIDDHGAIRLRENDHLHCPTPFEAVRQSGAQGRLQWRAEAAPVRAVR
jgi:hypothetical protein